MRKKTDACQSPSIVSGAEPWHWPEWARRWPSRGVVARLRWRRVVDIDKVVGCVSDWHCPRDVDFHFSFLLFFFRISFSFCFGDSILPPNSPHRPFFYFRFRLDFILFFSGPILPVEFLSPNKWNSIEGRCRRRGMMTQGRRGRRGFRVGAEEGLLEVSVGEGRGEGCV